MLASSAKCEASILSVSIRRNISGGEGSARIPPGNDPYRKWFLENRERLEAAGQIGTFQNPEQEGSELAAVLEPFSLFRCEKTGFIYANPRLRPQAAAEYFSSDAVTRYFEVVEAPESIVFRQKNNYEPIARFLTERLHAKSRLIEIGCGGGAFLEVLRNIGKFDVSGIEIADGAVPFWKRRDLPVHKMVLEDFDTTKVPEFDIVLMWSVMDHFCDPLLALRKCNGMLRLGGFIFIGNVNTDGFDHQCLGFDSATFSPPGRVNYYNKRSLARHLELAGFEIVDIATPGVLDVDMVRDYWRSGGPNGRHLFLENLILDETNAATAAAFQDFLQKNKLSGYQRVLAQKIKN